MRIFDQVFELLLLCCFVVIVVAAAVLFSLFSFFSPSFHLCGFQFIFLLQCSAASLKSATV